MRHFKSSLLALASSLALVACGGGQSADTTPRVQINSVKVFGDSLADSGTFGVKFTVQDGQVFPERVATSYGQTLCNFYVFTGTTFAANTAKTGCTNFAIGGGVINAASSSLTAADPRAVPVQLATAASVAAYSATDLVIIDGGGNDAAALVTAFLTAQATSNPSSLVTLLSSLLPPADVQAALAGGASTTAAIGGTYMKALADKFADSITANVIAKGAEHVVVLNMPAITKTPQFQGALAQIATRAGGGAAGQAARDQAEALFQTWFAAFNGELAARFQAESKVVVVDFYAAFLDQIANPTQYGIDTEGNSIFTELCPAADAGLAGWATCTSAALSAQSGHTNTSWWQHYAFANSFHPTPYGHQLVAQLISKSLAIKGWL